MYKDYDVKLRRTKADDYREYQRKFLEAFREHGCRSVLDLGCGQGVFLDLLAEAEIEGLGIDLDQNFVEEIRGRGFEALHGSALEGLDRLDRKFDGVFLSHLIEHHRSTDALELCRKIHNVLTPGGLVLIVTPNVRSLIQHLEIFYRDYTHERFYPAELIGFFLEQAGFEDVQSQELPESAYIQVPGVSVDSQRPERFSDKRFPSPRVRRIEQPAKALEPIAIPERQKPLVGHGPLARLVRRWLGVSRLEQDCAALHLASAQAFEQLVERTNAQLLSLARSQQQLSEAILETFEGLQQARQEFIANHNKLVDKVVNVQSVLNRDNEVVSFLVRHALRPNDISVSASRPVEPPA
ncbi:MAG: class I SAM-dependent methyltransferase [Candidatus Alcyoniella australis]|nr:class I SAM-dependent methyltransferase [Candidatus Alcyoniella australis]